MGERLHIRLFLEGLEVPVISAACTSAPNTPSVISIQIPAVVEAFKFLPRTLAHLFFYYPTKDDLEELDKYKLLFVGEIIGFAATQTPMGSSVVLQCMDLSNYWDSTYLFNATGLGKDGKKLSNFVGANTSVVSGSSGGSIFPDSKGSSGYSKVAAILNKKPASFPHMQGLLGGIVHLLESIGGFYRGFGQYKGFNDFTSLAELRLKLMQQLMASEADTTSAKLFNKKVLKKWIKQSIGAKGSMSSFNQVANQLMQFIFHQRHSIFAPPFHAKGDVKIIKKTVKVEGEVDVSDLLNTLARITHFRSPNYGAGYRICLKFYQACCTVRRECVARSKLERKRKNNTNANVLAQAAIKLYDAKPKGEYVTDMLKEGRKKAQTHRAGEPFYAKSKYVKPVNSERIPAYCRFLALVQEARNILLQLAGKGRATKYRTKSMSYTDPERLGVHFFLPDLYFAPPPKSNVIFPDYYDNLRFARRFLQEPTRLMLKGGSNRSGDIFGGGFSKMGVYFAPDIPSMRGSAKMSSKKFARTVMEHELYTGILPQQATIPWAKVYKIDVDGGGKKFPYIQRLTNFEYAKRRYGARTMSISGQFNWRPVPGFPIIIITGGMTDSKLALFQETLGMDEELDELMGGTSRLVKENTVGAHYVGYLNGLSHTLNQQGGRTDYNVSMVRNQWELSDEMGNLQEKVGGSGTRYLVVEQPRNIGKNLSVKRNQKLTKTISGPQGTRINRVGNVLGTPKKGHTYWQYRTDVIESYRDASKGSYKSSNPKWVKLKWVPDDAAIVNAGSASVVEVFVEKAKYKEKVINHPLEAALTPPWLDKVWHVDQIDQTYSKLLGISSVLEGVGIKADKTKFEWAERNDVAVKASGETKLDPEEGGDKLNEGKNAALVAYTLHKTIKDAVEHLALMYTYAQRSDVYNFIREYTDRPVATFSQIFGSKDFELSEIKKEKAQIVKKLNKRNEKNSSSVRPYSTRGPEKSINSDIYKHKSIQYDASYYKVISGEEGFHSRAVSDIDNIFSLVDEEVNEVLRLKRKSGDLLAKLDTRKEKREQVERYIKEIMFYSMS